MVGSELCFPAVTNPCLGACHDRCIVDQDVDGSTNCSHPLPETTGACKVAEVHLIDDHHSLGVTEAGKRLTGMVGASGRNDHVGTSYGKPLGCFETEARVAAGHHRELPRQVGTGDDLARRRAHSETRVDRVLQIYWHRRTVTQICRYRQTAPHCLDLPRSLHGNTNIAPSELSS